jgi:hypothetical protein
MSNALIVTHENDLHALLVQDELQRRHNISCQILEFDRLPITGGLSWSTHGDTEAFVAGRGGECIDITKVHVVWWRRFRGGPFQTPGPVSHAAQDLIEKDSRAAIEGLLLDSFRGSWVSRPEATRRADNKLVQLRAAQQAGMRIPRTLVSQDPDAIRRFCAKLGNRVVAKPVRGTHLAATVTVHMTESLLDSEESLRVCPAIYQELVEGTAHLRVHCFGSTVCAVQIDSRDLDWRPNLNVPMKCVALSRRLTRQLQHVLEILDLKMGIFDLKVDPDGTVFWLEVNPQGQFLFLEALVPVDLVAPLAAFLSAEANAGARSIHHGVKPRRAVEIMKDHRDASTTCRADK